MEVAHKVNIFVNTPNLKNIMRVRIDGTPAMRRLIIHADDFGLNEKVNAGILKAHLEGNLTSASVMANGAAFEHAVEICSTLQTLDIGVHLTLVGERPILAGDKVKTLVNTRGRFHDHARQFVQRYFCGFISLNDVRLELDAQIQKVLNTGIRISHLDSHQHLHMLPSILKVSVELAKKYNIPSIRFPREKFYFEMFREWRLLPRIMQLLVLGIFCYLGRNMDAVRTDFFFGFLFGGNLNKQNFLKILKRLPQSGICEIMCHPGAGDSDTSYSNWRYHWQDELNALLDTEITAILQEKSISLISYRDLVRH
jgi:chitin disaccharide deacetylase